MEKFSYELLANTDYLYPIADRTLHAAVIYNFSARRGNLVQSGKIIMTNRNTTFDADIQYTGDALGATIAGTVSGNTLNLSITIDNSSVDSVLISGSSETIKL